MIKSTILSLLLLWPMAQSVAADAPPSDASLHKLLSVMHAEQMLDSVMSQMNGYIKNIVNQIAPANKLSPKAQAILDRGMDRMVVSMKETMSWSVMEPMYLRIYRETFTQTEVDQMTAFYGTPTGQSMVKKMPLVMQNVMREMPTILKPMMERVQVIQREMAEELKRNAEQEKGAGQEKGAKTANP